MEADALHVTDTGRLKSPLGQILRQWFGEGSVLVYDFDKFDGADILSVIERQ
jgi:hypothetical protein